MNISIITFTENGTKLAEKIRQAFASAKTEEAKKLGLSLSDWTRQQFAEKNAIVVIGACGIAVRMIAPFVSDKLSDSPVIVADEAGTFVIPLLSGHVGGANELAEQIAGQIGGIPVITTATDVNDKLAIDVWATKRNLYIKEMEIAKEVAARLLDEKKVGFSSSLARFGLEEYDVPMGLTREKEEVGVVVSFDEEEQPFERTLHLIPKQIVLGVGCRKETKPEVFEEMVRNVLAKHQISRHAVCKLCSIDLKQEEKAILKLADKWNIPFETYSADELKKVQGTFTASSFVSQVTGVDNVCERSAVLGSRGTKRMKTKEEDREEDRLIVRKQAANGVTIALCIRREE